MDIERVVYTNINRFKESLSHISPSKKSENRREYRVLLDCDSGEMNFAKKIRELEGSLSSQGKVRSLNLKDVRLIVIDEPDGKARFEIRDDQNRLLESPDPKGVTKRTLEILNNEAQKIHKAVEKILPEKRIVQSLSMGQEESSDKEIETLPGWAGSLTIIEAERKLDGAQVGTYLIRTGDDATLMVNNMKKQYGEDIHPYFLVLVAEEEKISEILILHVSWGWIIKQDEPDLQSPSYKVFKTAKDLLGSLNHKLSKPLSR